MACCFIFTFLVVFSVVLSEDCRDRPGTDCSNFNNIVPNFCQTSTAHAFCPVYCGFCKAAVNKTLPCIDLNLSECIKFDHLVPDFCRTESSKSLCPKYCRHCKSELQCYSCNDILDPALCNTTVTCASVDQDCIIAGTVTQNFDDAFSLGCADKSHCVKIDSALPIVGRKKRYLQRVCCDSDLCNNYDPFSSSTVVPVTIATVHINTTTNVPLATNSIATNVTLATPPNVSKVSKIPYAINASTQTPTLSTPTVNQKTPPLIINTTTLIPGIPGPNVTMPTTSTQGSSIFGIQGTNTTPLNMSQIVVTSSGNTTNASPPLASQMPNSTTVLPGKFPLLPGKLVHMSNSTLVPLSLSTNVVMATSSSMPNSGNEQSPCNKSSICQWSDWSQSEACSKTCGGGRQLMRRNICCDTPFIENGDLQGCLKSCGFELIDAYKYLTCNKVCYHGGTFDSSLDRCICPLEYEGDCCEKNNNLIPTIE